MRVGVWVPWWLAILLVIAGAPIWIPILVIRGIVGVIHSRASKKRDKAQAKLLKEQARLVRDERVATEEDKKETYAEKLLRRQDEHDAQWAELRRRREERKAARKAS
jgi:hypothetical protein